MFEVLKRWGAMRYPWPLWLIPVLLISPAALLIPVNVFDQYPWAKTYAQWLAQWIPMIDRAAHLHPHPQQFKAFFAYAWSWLPLCLVLGWFDGFEKRIRTSKKEWQRPSILLPCCLLVLYTIAVLWFAPGSIFSFNGVISFRDERAVLYRSEIAWLCFAPLQTYAVATSLPYIYASLRVLQRPTPSADFN